MPLSNERNSAILTLNEKNTRCPAFCDCKFPNCLEVANHTGPIPELVTCHCGEETTHKLAWKWELQNATDFQIIDNDIIFHPSYSQGTAIVRGNKPLQSGMVHFWEMRILTALSGTDVMFGIGTDHVLPKQFRFHFVSALGINSQSWGYSFYGEIQHNGEKIPYGQKFSQGCLLGIYLDRTCGHLKFYLNRRSLGVAYTNIPIDPQVKIYPMVCSTAAKSVVRLINATAELDVLQLRAFQTLSHNHKHMEELRQMPSFRRIIQDYWFMAPPVRYSQRSQENEYDINDEVVLSAKTRLGRKQKFKDEDADINDLYSNAHKIALHTNESDDEEQQHTATFVHDYYDEYFHYLL